MAKGGRPSKSNKQKELQGTLKKCRAFEPVKWDSLSAIPEPPKHLNEVGGWYFKTVCGLLIEKDALSAAFLFDIGRGALWYQTSINAAESVGLDGGIQTTPNGYTAITASLTILEKASKQLTDFESRYGLNLTASQKIVMPEKKKGGGLIK